MAQKYFKWPQTIKHISFQGRPKITQLGIFGKKVGMPSGNPGWTT
jgi:hypothetical protein